MDLVLSLPLTDDDVARLTVKAGGRPVELWLADHVWDTVVLLLRHQQLRQAQRAVVVKLRSMSEADLTKVSDAIETIQADERVRGGHAR